jgi:CheY-like chemotaxis protein
MASNLEIALMSLKGADVRIANSAVEAMEILNSPADSIAAVVTDLEMPKMNGFELIERMRALPRYTKTPIIVSSGSPDPDSPARARALGANAYFTKPYSPVELRRKLELLLSETYNV